jgi:hypothetical protein
MKRIALSTVFFLLLISLFSTSCLASSFNGATLTTVGPVDAEYSAAKALDQAYFNVVFEGRVQFAVPKNSGCSSFLVMATSDESYSILSSVSSTITFANASVKKYYPSSTAFTTKYSDTEFNLFTSRKYRYYYDNPSILSNITGIYKFFLNDRMG